MISELVSQVVMDRRGSVSASDFTSTYGVSVGNLVQKFSELDRYHELEAESSDNREQLIHLAAENKELKLELAHWRNQEGGQSSTASEPVKEVSLSRSSRRKYCHYHWLGSKKKLFSW